MTWHEFLVLVAKTLGLFWMLALFLLAAWHAYRPANRARHERAGRSILDDRLMAGGRPE